MGANTPGTPSGTPRTPSGAPRTPPGVARDPHGLRVSRVPSKPVQREADGRYAIHLWLQQDGRFDADLALRLSPAEAEMLHAQLCFALEAEPVTTPAARTPDCRSAVLGGTGARWP